MTQLSKVMLSMTIVSSLFITNSSYSVTDDTILNRYGRDVCSGPWQFMRYQECSTGKIVKSVPAVRDHDDSGNVIYWEMELVPGEQTPDVDILRPVYDANGNPKRVDFTEYDEVVPSERDANLGGAKSCWLSTGQVTQQITFEYPSIITSKGSFVDHHDYAKSFCEADAQAELDKHPLKGEKPSQDDFGLDYFRLKNGITDIEYLGFSTKCDGTEVGGFCSGSYKKVHESKCRYIIERVAYENRKDAECGPYPTIVGYVAVKYEKARSASCGIIPVVQGTIADVPEGIDLFQSPEEIENSTYAKIYLSKIMKSRDEIKKHAPYDGVFNEVCLTGETSDSPDRFSQLRKAYENSKLGSYNLNSNHVLQRTAFNIRQYKVDQLTPEEAEFRRNVIRIGSPRPKPLLQSDIKSPLINQE